MASMTHNGDSNPLTRGLKLGLMLAEGLPITTQLIREQFGVSRPTAQRDLVAIQTALQVDVQVAATGAVAVTLERP
jgi:predicted DNA-binding transcriptional regulator YafY